MKALTIHSILEAIDSYRDSNTRESEAYHS
jgi:hypothetical protein